MDKDTRKYEAKETARFSLMEALRKYLSAADGYEMGAQETADELSDIFHDQEQPYRVEVKD